MSQWNLVEVLWILAVFKYVLAWSDIAISMDII